MTVRNEVSEGVSSIKTKSDGQKAAIEGTAGHVRDRSEVERSRNLSGHIWQRTKKHGNRKVR